MIIYRDRRKFITCPLHGRGIYNLIVHFWRLGDEFAIILPESDATYAVDICDILKEAVCNLGIEHKHSSVDKKVITISIGTATYIPHEKNISSESLLFNAADDALYKAKCSDRNKSIL